jgi:hypothetical protein
VEVGGVVAEQLVEVEGHAGGVRVAVAPDDPDRLEVTQGVAHGREAGEEAAVLDDRHLRVAVAGEVRDLVGRRRVVDRDRRRPAHERRHVEHVELRAVAHHQDDALARGEAHRLEPRRHARDPVAVLREGPLVPPVAGLPAQRHLIAHVAERRDEVAGGRAALDDPVDLRARDHASPPSVEPQPPTVADRRIRSADSLDRPVNPRRTPCPPP